MALIVGYSSQAQTSQPGVMKPVERLFEGMKQGDSSMVRSAFTPDALMYSAFTNKEGTPTLRKGSLDRFLEAVGSPHKEVWNEPIWNEKVEIDGNLAQVWVDYAFYLDNKFLHCGVDAFQLFFNGEEWKIFVITDTRKKEGCDIPEDVKKKFQQ